MALLGVMAIVLMSMLAQNILEDGLKRVEDVFKDSKKVENIQQNFIIPLFKLREATLSMTVAPEGKYKRDIANTLTPLVEELDYAFSSMDSSFKEIWENYKRLIFVKNGYKNYKRFVYVSDGNIKEDYKTGGFVHTKSVERKQFYILISKLQKLQSKQLENSYKTYQSAKKCFLKKQKIIIAGAIFVIVLTLIFGFLIARSIVNSLETIQAGLCRFFKLLGREIDKDTKIKIDLDAKDEFGEMAKMINKNIEVLRENLNKDIKLIEDATNIVSYIKKGDLDKRLVEEASSRELNRLKEIMNEMLDDLEDKIVAQIKERTKQEQLLIQQSKLAAMGNMIGNIAHQWRQPLSELNAILMNLQVKKEHNDLSDEDFEKSIEECDVILSYMSNTISDFQNFFKPSKEKSVFSLKEECRNASYIIESSLKYNNIDFVIDIEEDCEVFGYPREFSQAILNILSNAKDVLVERKVENPFIRLTLKRGKKFAVVKIEDNAGGVKNEYMERVFEPYFTTKHSTKGTGIGLYMSKIIIEDNMHGHIDLKNTKNGALFVIKLLIYNP